MNTEKEYDLGVIVGRFQTPELLESHRKLFDYVCSKHEIVICYLGLSPIMGDLTDPLNFHQRKVMINEVYPDVQCFYINDYKLNSYWAKKLDGMITDYVAPGQQPLLYGSRDSFIKSYKEGAGRFDCEELESDSFISSAQMRKQTTRSIIANKFVRMGYVLASQLRYPTAFTTVDIAIMDNNREKIWLGRKENETKFRFIGGFSDPSSPNLESDAVREAMEETHLIVDEPKYICSMKIDDWRYRGKTDCIKTTFWIADRIGGDPQADDDIVEIQCFDVDDFVSEEGYGPLDQPYKLDNIVSGHNELMRILLEYLGK